MREYAQARGWIVEDQFIRSRGWSQPKEANFPGIDAWRGGRDPVASGKAGQQLVEGADVFQIKSMKPSETAIKLQFDSGTKGLAETSWTSPTMVIRKAKSRTLVMVIDADMSSVASGTRTMVKNMMSSLTGGKNIKVEWYFQDLAGKFKAIPIK
jgi:hypothetical protein